MWPSFLSGRSGQQAELDATGSDDTRSSDAEEYLNKIRGSDKSSKTLLDRAYEYITGSASNDKSSMTLLDRAYEYITGSVTRNGAVTRLDEAFASIRGRYGNLDQVDLAYASAIGGQSAMSEARSELEQVYAFAKGSSSLETASKEEEEEQKPQETETKADEEASTIRSSEKEQPLPGPALESVLLDEDDSSDESSLSLDEEQELDESDFLDQGQDEDVSAEEESLLETSKEKAISAKVLELVRNTVLTAPQKAKELARFMKRLVPGLRKAGNYAWEAAMWWMLKNKKMLITSLVLAAASGLVLAVLLPFLAPSLGLPGLVLPAGKLALIGGTLFSYLGSVLGTVAKSWLTGRVFEAIKKAPLIRNFMDYDLLAHPSIQRTLSFLPEDRRHLPVRTVFEWVQMNMQLYCSTATWSDFVLGKTGFSVPIPLPNTTGFAAGKAFQYTMTYGPVAATWAAKSTIGRPVAAGATLVGKGAKIAAGGVARTTVSGVSATGRAARRALTGMFQALEGAHEFLTEDLETNESASAIRTRTAEWVEQRRKERPDQQVTAHDVLTDGASALESDTENPEVQASLSNAMQDAMVHMDNKIDQHVAAAVANEPKAVLEELVVKQVVSPSRSRRMETEQNANVAHEASSQILKTAAGVGGALLLGAVAYQYGSSVNIAHVGDSIGSLVPNALKDSIAPYLTEASKTFTAKAAAQHALYQMLSRTVGVQGILRHYAGMLPLDRINALQKLDRKLQDTSEKAIAKRGKNAIKLINLLVGSRLYTAAEIKGMTRRDLLRALKDANADVPSARLPDNVLRDVLTRIQKQNVRHLHRMIIGALVGAMTTTVIATHGSQLGASLFTEKRDLALWIVKNPFLAMQAGLDQLEIKSLEAVLSEPVEQDPSGLTFFGVLDRNARLWAQRSGSAWDSVASGVQKLSIAMGLKEWQGGVLAGQGSTLATRAEYRDTVAKSKGYPDWDAMKTAIDAKLQKSQQNHQEWLAKQGGVLVGKGTALSDRDARKDELAKSRGFQDWGAMKAAAADSIQKLADARQAYEKQRRPEKLSEKDQESIQQRQSERLAAQQTSQLAQRLADLLDSLKRGNPKATDSEIQAMFDQLKGSIFAQAADQFFSQSGGSVMGNVAADLSKQQGPVQQVKPLYEQPAGPEQATRPADYLPPKLREVLDFQMLPASIGVIKNLAEKVEGASGGPLTALLREWNDLSDLGNGILFANQIVDALVNDFDLLGGANNEEEEGAQGTQASSSFSGKVGSTLRNWIPAAVAATATDARIPRIDTIVETLRRDPRVKEMIDKEAFNLADVVGEAFVAKLTGQTTTAGMLGRIGGVVAVGKRGADTGQKTGEVVGAVSAKTYQFTKDVVDGFHRLFKASGDAPSPFI